MSDQSRTLNVFRPFTTAQAAAAGITEAMLRGPTYRRIFRGVYVAARVRLSLLLRVEAALMLFPSGAFASHQTAGRLYRLPVPESPLVHVSVGRPADRRRREGIRCHVAGHRSLRRLGTILVSAPGALFLELAGVLPLVDLVVLGDAMVRHKLLTVEELLAVCAAYEGKHARAARRAAGYVRRDVDSAMETRLRMLIVLAGLPEPKVNVIIFAEDGSVRFRIDLSYPELRLMVEYDGEQHRLDLDQWDTDNAREDWFSRHDWRRVGVISRGIYRSPDVTIRRVHSALKDRGCPDLPRVLSEEWRAHFPVRPRLAAAS